MLEARPTILPGCYELQPRVLKDERGFFVKTFHEVIFGDLGLETHFAEEYYSYSQHGVLRGLHFQTPPMDHVKLVYCISGAVMDVVVDLRVGSPAYGQHEIIELNAEKANMVYIPRGMAHGFYVTGDHAVLQYKVTSVYAPNNDGGILWNSIGIEWPDLSPIISQRDQAFPSFQTYHSPFIY